jgi:hypothetical protein
MTNRNPKMRIRLSPRDSAPACAPTAENNDRRSSGDAGRPR